MKYLRNKRGSATIMLAMIALAFSALITATIVFSRQLVVKSECNSFSRLWSKAILSEYDVNLLKDYGILAFQGNERYVKGHLNFFMKYSFEGKLDAGIEGSGAALDEYCLADSDNFLKAIKNGVTFTAAEGLKKREREKREESEESGNREIKNSFVIRTLPSRGDEYAVDEEKLSDKLDKGILKRLEKYTSDTFAEVGFIKLHFGNYLYEGDVKDTFLNNEWEYLISGKLSDEKNYSSCRRRIFVIRNALNLKDVYADPEKLAFVNEIAAIISPGPAALVTQAIIAETWAAAETEEDLKKLYGGERVPFFKEPGDWQIGLESILDSDSFKEKLDEESKKLLDENKEEIKDGIPKLDGIKDALTEGQNYEDYLMLLMMFTGRETLRLRMMDIVQINMKFKYYRDFNMEEYYTGVDISISANGREYEVQDEYK